MGNQHYHYTVYCGKLLLGIIPTRGKMIEPVSIEVIANSEQEAIEKAKYLVDRDVYRLTYVRECFFPDTPEAIEKQLDIQEQLRSLFEEMKKVYKP